MRVYISEILFRLAEIHLCSPNKPMRLHACVYVKCILFLIAYYKYAVSFGVMRQPFIDPEMCKLHC